ncbi:MAG: site-2 protease family protein [Pseudomonadota bacterium]
MFGNPVRAFEILGFQVKVDASWLIIAALLVWTLSSGYFPQEVAGLGQTDAVVLSVAAMLGLFASLILHELAHSLVARRFGLRVGSITLFLFGGVAELDEEPASARSEVLIALAGPVASLVLAALLWVAMQMDRAADLSPALRALLGYLAGINLVLAVFNLLPAFPMDGGRVLRATLWARSGDLVGATRIAVRVAAMFAYALVALGILSLFSPAGAGGFWFALIGIYLLLAAQTTYAQLMLHTALKGRTVRDLMTRAPVTTPPEATLADVVDNVMLAHARSFVPVVEGDHLLGYVDTGMLTTITRENWADTHVADIFEPLGPDNSVQQDVTADALLDRIARTGRRKFLVADQGQLVGVISLTDLVSSIGVMTALGGIRGNQGTARDR